MHQIELMVEPIMNTLVCVDDIIIISDVAEMIIKQMMESYGYILKDIGEARSYLGADIGKQKGFSGDTFVYFPQIICEHRNHSSIRKIWSE